MNEWLMFALSSAIIGGALSLIHRSILKEHDYVSYLFLFGIISSIFFIPLLMLDFKISLEITGLEILILGIVVWTIGGILSYKAISLLEISVRDPINNIKLIFLLLLSYILLSEIVTTSKILGTLSIFLGMIVLSYKRGTKFGRLNDKGVQLTLLSAFILAFAGIIDKAALTYWSPATYAFMVFLFPSVILGVVTAKRFDKFKHLVLKKGSIVIVASILVTLLYYLELKAYTLTDVSNAFPIARMSVLFSVLGGIIILNERKEIGKKLIATALMILGIFFISGYLVI